MITASAPKTAATWILAGPTACGKTAAALALAQEIAIEVISVDSALIYKSMDIGTWSMPFGSHSR